MGFFGIDLTTKRPTGGLNVPRGKPVELLHREGCSACSLNHAKVCNPKMKPDGTRKPMIYVLTEAPSAEGDENNLPLDGYEYRMIMSAIPASVRDQVRMGTVIRTHPGEGKEVKTKNKDEGTIIPTLTPTPLQIECCRPSVVADIEKTKPVAIFGFGAVPLRWAANETHANQWTGRRMPVKIGTHTCWYYPFLTPFQLMIEKKWDDHVSEYEMTFVRHIKNACREIFNENDFAPFIHTEEYVRRGVSWVMGDEGMSDVRKVEKFFDRAVQEEFVGLDYETNALRPYNNRAKLLTGAVAIKGVAFGWPFEHKDAKWTKKEKGMVYDAFEEFLYDERPRKIAHQLPFEMEWSAFHFGKDVLRAGLWGDSLSQAYVIDEMQGMLSLEALTTQHYGFNIKDLSKVDRKNLENTPLIQVLPYNAIDAKYHRRLFIDQAPVITDEGLDDVYAHQLRRIPTLVLTTMQGVPIDQKQVTEYRDGYEGELAKLWKSMHRDDFVRGFPAKYGHAFNPLSPDDIKKFLTFLGQPNVKTDEAFMSKIDDPLIKEILAYRKITKLNSTYVVVVSEAHVNHIGEHVEQSPHLYDDKLIHPIISTTKVRTARTSSEEPNIQNWPKRGPSVIIRKQVAALPGHKLYAVDYAGIQARNVAMESRDPTLMKFFWDRKDVHDDFMNRMIEFYPQWIKEGESVMRKDKGLFKQYRHLAKNKFVFPTFFGAQPKRVSEDCGVPLEIGEQMQDMFFERFPKIKTWQLNIQEFYKRNGYVTGHSGYRRRAPVSWNELINAPIQADEAMIVMDAMSALSELDYERYQACMEIHDDLTFMIPDKGADAVLDTIITEMVKPRYDWINVPLVVEVSRGDNWCDLVHIGDYENTGNNGYVEIHK